MTRRLARQGDRHWLPPPERRLFSLKLTFDFHLHSCLSPCASEENTPANLAGMCALAGLEAVALTDHNTVGNCAPFLAAAGRLGLVALPGMELTTAEEVHVICLFPDLPSAQAFGDAVYRRLPPLPNDPRIFGPQLLMDDGDGILGEEHRLLAGATAIGVYESAALVASYGGFAYPAHIDRPSFSVLSNLGLWDPGLGFSLAEITRSCSSKLLHRPDLLGLPTLTASDAHDLSQIADPDQTLEVDAATSRAILAALRGPDFLLRYRRTP